MDLKNSRSRLERINPVSFSQEAILEAVLFSMEQSAPEGVKVDKTLLTRLLVDETIRAYAFIKDNRVAMLLTVSIVVRAVLGLKALYVESAYSTGPLKNSDWKLVIEVLKEEAKARGCNRLEVVSCNERVREICELAGADTSFFLARLEV